MTLTLNLALALALALALTLTLILTLTLTRRGSRRGGVTRRATNGRTLTLTLALILTLTLFLTQARDLLLARRQAERAQGLRLQVTSAPLARPCELLRQYYPLPTTLCPPSYHRTRRVRCAPRCAPSGARVGSGGARRGRSSCASSTWRGSRARRHPSTGRLVTGCEQASLARCICICILHLHLHLCRSCSAAESGWACGGVYRRMRRRGSGTPCSIAEP